MTTFEARARPVTAARRRNTRHGALVSLTALAVVGILVYRLIARTASTADARVESHVTSVSPAGRGRVRALHVRDNQVVDQGQLLMEIELDELVSQIEVLVAERDGALATLRAARAQVALTERAARASLTQARGGVLQAGYGLRALDASTRQAEHALRAARARREHLESAREASETASRASSQGALPEPSASRETWPAQSLEEARAAEAAAQAQLDRVLAARSTSWGSIVAARGKLEEASSLPEQLEVARASVAQAEASLAEAEARLKLAQRGTAAGLLRSPTAGSVTQLDARVGQLVTPDKPLLTIVANDARWVAARFDEARRDAIRVGQAAKITIDAVAPEPLEAHVESVGPSEVLLRFDHQEQARALQPGMRAAVSVIVED